MEETLLEKAKRLGIKPASTNITESLLQKAQRLGVKPAGTPMGNVSSVPQTPYSGVLGTNPSDTIVGKLLDNSITRGIQSFFPGKKVGEAIGTLGGYVASGFNPNYDTSAPSPLQVAGDVAQGALMVGTGMPEGSVGVQAFGKVLPTLKTSKTIGGRILQTTGLGAGYGLTGALSGGITNPQDIAMQTAFGSILGGTLGVSGEALSKFVSKVPNRIVSNLLPQLKRSDTLDYALNNIKLGSVDNMVASSNLAKKSFFNQINSILDNPETIHKAQSLGGDTINGNSIFKTIEKAFPNSEETSATFFSKLKTLSGNNSALVTKLQNGGLKLKEGNVLREAIGENIFKSKIDSPEVKANKDLGAKAYEILSNFIKTRAPETAPIFDSYSKEINLNKALKILQQKQLKKSAVSWKELLTAFGASGLFGPSVGVGILAGEKVASTPTVRVGTARLLKNSNNVTKQALNVSNKIIPMIGKIPVVNQPNQINQ